jgi:hypothetical protein
MAQLNESKKTSEETMIESMNNLLAEVKGLRTDSIDKFTSIEDRLTALEEANGPMPALTAPVANKVVKEDGRVELHYCENAVGTAVNLIGSVLCVAVGLTIMASQHLDKGVSYGANVIAPPIAKTVNNAKAITVAARA